MQAFGNITNHLESEIQKTKNGKRFKKTGEKMKRQFVEPKKKQKAKIMKVISEMKTKLQDTQ